MSDPTWKPKRCPVCADPMKAGKVDTVMGDQNIDVAYHILAGSRDCPLNGAWNHRKEDWEIRTAHIQESP